MKILGFGQNIFEPGALQGERYVRRFQNLKQNLSTVEELTNEFYQLSIRVDHQETDEQLAARYVNCLNFSIQDELSMHRVRNVEEAYQLALKAKEKEN